MASYKLSRRRFLKSAVGMVAAPCFIPAHVLGRDGGVPPSNRLAIAAIGVGGQGRYHLRHNTGRKDVQIVAVADVDRRHLDQASTILENAYGSTQNIRFMQDFRELLSMKDQFDVALIATPDHTHAICSLAMLRAGKDVYCEKPLTRTVLEGRVIADTAQQFGRILQTGSHERSNARARYVADVVRNGYLGRIHRVDVNMPNTSHERIPPQKPVDPPAELDYDLWLGPAPHRPYFYSDLTSSLFNTNYQRCHFWFRYQLDYATGEMSDRGAHILDLVQMILDKDDTGPVELWGTGNDNIDSEFDTFMDYEFGYKYADGVEIMGTSNGTNATRGLTVHGDNGWINVHVHGCRLTASDPKLLEIEFKPSDITVGRIDGHHQNFYDAVRHRGPVVASAEVGHRTASVCHILTTAMQLGRPLKWDPVAEQFPEDPEANRLLHYKYREPWTL